MGNTIEDDIFGKLELDDLGFFFTRKYEMTLFDIKWDIELSIDTYDDEPVIITDMQKKAYMSFLEEKETIISKVEEKLKEYYYSKKGTSINESISKKDIEELFELRVITFPWSKNKLIYGFLFESTLEIEHGIGVKICNGEIEVGFQDIII